MPLRWGRRTATAVLAVLLAGAVAGGLAARRQPAAPAYFGGDAAALGVAPSRLVIGQYNIHRGQGRDGRPDLQRVADCLRGADLAALNEVAGPGLLGPENQADQLAGQLGLTAIFAPTELRFWHADFGNALLSNTPLLSWMRVALPRDQDSSYRNLLLAELPFGDGRLSVLITHVGAEADHDLQLAAVLSLFRQLAPPAILVGDLNTRVTDTALAQLMATPGVVASNGAADPAAAPNSVDWIIAKGLGVSDPRSCDQGGSDHASTFVTVQPLP